MQLLTRQSMAADTHKRWIETYDPNRRPVTTRFRKIGIELEGQTDPDTIDKIIGNTSWTHAICSECVEYRDMLIVFSNSVICESCLAKANKLLEGHTNENAHLPQPVKSQDIREESGRVLP